MCLKVEACLADNASVALPHDLSCLSPSDLRVTRLATQFGVTRSCRTIQLTIAFLDYQTDINKW